MEMFLNDYLPNEIRKVIGLIENNLDLVFGGPGADGDPPWGVLFNLHR